MTDSIDGVLLAVDHSDASDKEVEYVVDMLASKPQAYLHLVHVLPPVSHPEDASESAGPMDEAKKVLEGLRARICARGIDEEHVDMGVLVIDNEAKLVDGLIETAQDQGCGTIAIGRHALPWYRELFHHHPADELVKRAQGFAVWIVE